MDLNKLKKDELLKLKDDIDSQLKYIDSLKKDIKLSNEKNRLLDLKHDDKIFCIDFRGSEIFHMDYVKINFRKQDDKDYINFSTKHDTKNIGCSSILLEESMDKHYFLSEFYSSMYFFTLKPESWREDLKNELERTIKNKRVYFNEEISKLKNTINSLIKSNEVDNFISNLS